MAAQLVYTHEHCDDGGESAPRSTQTTGNRGEAHAGRSIYHQSATVYPPVAPSSSAALPLQLQVMELSRLISNFSAAWSPHLSAAWKHSRGEGELSVKKAILASTMKYATANDWLIDDILTNLFANRSVQFDYRALSPDPDSGSKLISPFCKLADFVQLEWMPISASNLRLSHVWMNWQWNWWHWIRRNLNRIYTGASLFGWMIRFDECWTNSNEVIHLWCMHVQSEMYVPNRKLELSFLSLYYTLEYIRICTSI